MSSCDWLILWDSEDYGEALYKFINITEINIPILINSTKITDKYLSKL